MSCEKKILIAGGCFPVQDNIPPQQLYHQVIKKILIEEYNIDLKINIIRYDKLNDASELILNSLKNVNPEYFLFHLRVEPLFRYIKFFYKYHNHSDKSVASINFSFLGIHNLRIRKKSERPGNFINLSSTSRHFLSEMNYALGFLLGNIRYAFRIYSTMLQKVIKYCLEHNINLIITGPVSRPVSFFENLISTKLFYYFNKIYKKDDIKIINCLGLVNNEGASLFCDDNIRVNEIGHLRFAKIICENDNFTHTVPLIPDN
jgi:hypothetical protein